MAIIPSNSVDPKSVPGGTGKLVLLLGGIAFVVAAVLVVAGVFYFSRTQAADPAVETPQSTPTTLIATPTVGLVVESAPTEAPQVVMIVTSPTPTVTPTNPPVVTETAGSSEVVRSPTATPPQRQPRRPRRALSAQRPRPRPGSRLTAGSSRSRPMRISICRPTASHFNGNGTTIKRASRRRMATALKLGSGAMLAPISQRAR